MHHYYKLLRTKKGSGLRRPTNYCRSALGITVQEKKTWCLVQCLAIYSALLCKTELHLGYTVTQSVK